MPREQAKGFFSEKNVRQLLFLEVLRATFEAFTDNYFLKKANSDKNDDEDNDNEQSGTGKAE